MDNLADDKIASNVIYLVFLSTQTQFLALFLPQYELLQKQVIQDALVVKAVVSHLAFSYLDPLADF